jgi:hypothetical protein
MDGVVTGKEVLEGGGIRGILWCLVGFWRLVGFRR